MKTLLLTTLLAAAAGSAQAALVYSQTFDVFDDVPTSSIYFDAAPEYDGIVGGLTGADLDANANLNGKLVTSGASGRLPQSGTHFLHSNTLGTPTGSIPAGEVWGTNASQVPTVEIGTIYEFSFYIAAQNGTGPAIISPRINGVELQGLTVDGETNPANATYTAFGSWVKHTYYWEADTTTADLSLFNLRTADAGNDFYLDTITFSSVPEPGAALLGAFGFLGLMRRRR
ncbi:PEP-CTERM sorting domain-containing protein [Luteolibacter luteus]|uniref:PEP-CTERM sorting domain-containing protein n=1 Tax=Luteolibacter luteus TaxID=2728835 RepID=A0A858RSC9_9BACT|nr:PEP-CTERM sorting domain-containing protein [Luteolibacter luteus]QJE99090.1 PEP-CTERM sorting domain-containing protein [Luteolibacter luteus]